MSELFKAFSFQGNRVCFKSLNNGHPKFSLPNRSKLFGGHRVALGTVYSVSFTKVKTNGRKAKK